MVGAPTHIVVLFCCHASCSVSMVLLNKTISQELNFPWTVIFMQNVGTVLVGFLYGRWRDARESTRDSVKSPDSQSRKEAANGTLIPVRRTILGMTVPLRTKNRLWLVAQSAVFVATLFTSLRALHYISVPLYVVARNSVPAVTSLLEYCVDGTTVSPVGLVGIVVTVLGTLLYTIVDKSVEFVGFSYAISQVLVVALASAIDKASVRIQSSEEQIEPAEVNQIRVAMSMPVNVLLVAGFETFGGEGPGPTTALEPLFIKALADASTLVWSCIVLSTVFGFGMGTFNFCLQKEVSATTVQVANISYKLVSTIISRATHPAPVPAVGWLGYAVSLAGIAIYTLGPKLLSPAAAPSIPPIQLESRESKSEEEEEEESDSELARMLGKPSPSWRSSPGPGRPK